MQYPTIALVALFLPFALALPNTNSHAHLHKHEHKPYQSGGSSGAPFPSGTGGPFALQNATAGAVGTGIGTAASSRKTIYSTIHNTLYDTAQASATGGGLAQAPGADGAGGAGSVGGAGSAPSESASVAAESGNCAAPVTVTYSPTVTITVTSSGGSPAQSVVQSAPIASASSVASSSSASIASVSSAPEAAETEAPVISSVIPVVASSAAPVVPQAPVSTQAASSAAVVSSAAPVQSVQASPIGLAVQPVSSAASVVASPTSAAAASNNAPAATPIAGGKRGIAFVDGGPGTEGYHLTEYANKAAKISWLNNFFAAPPPNLNSPTVEFIPQMYGLDSASDWANYGAHEYANGSKYMFSFGEPETVNAKLHQEPDTAVSNWIKWMQPYAGNVSIGAPSVLQGDDDLKWLKAFLAGCSAQKPQPCKLGFVALHWVYTADLGNVQGFKNAVNAAINATSLPIWVDNFQAGGTSDQQIAFLKEVVPWLENEPRVQRYGYLPPAIGNNGGYATFLNADGSPSDLANFYANM